MLTPIAEWLNTVCAPFDHAVTAWIHQLYLLCGGFFTPFMTVISFFGNGGVILIIVSVLLLLPKDTRRHGTGMCLGLAIGALLVNVFLKVAVARPRPYLDEADIYYQYWKLVGMRVESDMSFPSGHTNCAFCTMIPLWLTLRHDNRKWYFRVLPWIFAVLMGISRIYLCVHYPTDVIGGMITGIFSGVIGYIIAVHLPAAWYRWEINKRQKA